jgi:hypothetical protein
LYSFPSIFPGIIIAQNMAATQLDPSYSVTCCLTILQSLQESQSNFHKCWSYTTPLCRPYNAFSFHLEN